MTITQILILLVLYSSCILMLWLVIYLWGIPKSFKEDAKIQKEIDKLKLEHGEYTVQQMYKLLERNK